MPGATHSYHYGFFNSTVESTRSIESIQRTKINSVIKQLEAFTHRSFIVDYTNTSGGALAIPCQNKILLSYEHLYSNISIDKIAGALAHEWGHMCDKTLICDMPTKKSEYSADEFAAYFLAKHGYPIEPEIDTVTRGPEARIDLYGTHAERAQHLRDCYQNASSSQKPHPYTVPQDELPKVSRAAVSSWPYANPSFQSAVFFPQAPMETSSSWLSANQLFMRF